MSQGEWIGGGPLWLAPSYPLPRSFLTQNPNKRVKMKYSIEKRKEVLRRVREIQNVKATAHEYNIPYRTVASWVRAESNALDQRDARAIREEQKKERRCRLALRIYREICKLKGIPDEQVRQGVVNQLVKMGYSHEEAERSVVFSPLYGPIVCDDSPLT